VNRHVVIANLRNKAICHGISVWVKKWGNEALVKYSISGF
jgi:hypothetical protein